MKMIIDPAENGATIRTAEPRITVYKFDEENPDGLVALLYDVRDSMLSSSRYDRYRVIIKVGHGDKYECAEDDCSICDEV